MNTRNIDEYQEHVFEEYKNYENMSAAEFYKEEYDRLDELDLPEYDFDEFNENNLS